MKWQTAIAEVQVDDVIIRGHWLSDLVGTVTYSDMAFLLIRGSLPRDGEGAMLEAILVSMADHGISPTSIIARTLTSCGTPLQASLSGAFLSVADWHGGSGERVAQILTELGAAVGEPDDPSTACKKFVSAARERREQVPGFGHPQHSGGDPRARQLLALADSLGVAGSACAALRQLGEALATSSGKEPLRAPNITGAVAGILLDLGFPWQSVRGIVISARSLGLTAHVVEELEQGNKWRHAPGDDVSYTGRRPEPISTKSSAETIS